MELSCKIDQKSPHQTMTLPDGHIQLSEHRYMIPGYYLVLVMKLGGEQYLWSYHHFTSFDVLAENLIKSQ